MRRDVSDNISNEREQMLAKATKKTESNLALSPTDIRGHERSIDWLSLGRYSKQWPTVKGSRQAKQSFPQTQD